MAPTEREILEAVASGQMTPGEAAERLNETRRLSDTGRGEPPDGHDAPPADPLEGRDAVEGRDVPTGEGGRFSQAAGTGSELALRVSATARSVRVIGDPSVAEATVDGFHRVRRDGNTLFVDGNIELDEPGAFTFEGRRPPWHRQWANWRRFAEPLVVRVHPGCPVDAEVSAGSLTVVGVTGPLHIVIAAGSARLDGIVSPIDVEARAGAVRVRGRLDAGESRIRCEAGSVNVQLTRGSDVRVRARADLGRVRVQGVSGHEPQLGSQREVTIGAGTATLDIEAAMGSVDVHTEEPLATASYR
jgi:hypothetical protein